MLDLVHTEYNEIDTFSFENIEATKRKPRIGKLPKTKWGESFETSIKNGLENAWIVTHKP